MTEELSKFIESKYEPISSTLARCGIDHANHQRDTWDQVIDLAKANINIFPFSDVKPCWFQLFAYASIAKAAEHLRAIDSIHPLDYHENSEDLSRVISTLDNALIIAGGGDEDTKQLIYTIIQNLDHLLYPRKPNNSDDDIGNEDSQPSLAKVSRSSDNTTADSPSYSVHLPTNLAFVPKIFHPVPHLDNPSLARFESAIHTSNEPVILANTLTHWPALRKWHDAEYWRRRTLKGLRLIPIEIGQSYTDEGWRQEIMTFNQFLQDFIVKGDDAEEIGYLAQHDLFSQMPELRADIEVPQYCFADVPTGSSGSDTKENAKSMSLAPVESNGDMLGNTPTTSNKSLESSGRAQNSTGTVSTESCNSVIRTTDLSTRPSDSHRLKRKVETSVPTAASVYEDNNSVKRARLHRSSTSSLSGLEEENGIADQSETNSAFKDQNSDGSDPSSAHHSESSTPLSPSPPPAPTIHQNIWFGTRTVTPLHHDPYSNILTQIHGTKYIRLYSPKYTTNLYPRSSEEVAPHVPANDAENTRSSAEENGAEEEQDPKPTIDMSNTSTIPLWSIEQSPHEDWDEIYPGFSQVPYVECLLREGEALYIPKGWWHYVRGVSATGIGVSFWW